MKRYLILFLFGILSCSLFAQPSGFSINDYMSGWDLVVGLAFDENGRMYAYEKSGKVYTIDNGVKSSTPLIDISEEVGNWRDFGLVGFALDPSFLTNGYIYLFYVVDRHHLLYHGTPAYVSTADEYYNATIGRITRYTAEASTNFTTVDYSSRLVLLGETVDTGIPVLHQSHGVGSLVFGDDESLLVSCGDGASYSGVDVGGAQHGSFAAQGLLDGIIGNNEDIGCFRSQYLESLNGKVLRLDKSTGDGLPSNPYYDAVNPRSPRSRTWALGLRNPARMTLKPGTGSPATSDGNPGTLLVGDVGWDSWEELNVITGPGMNFGWPIWEGPELHVGYDDSNVENESAPTPPGCSQTYYRFDQLVQSWTGSLPSYPDPCSASEIDDVTYDLTIHYPPTFSWKHDGSEVKATMLDGTIYSIDDVASPVTGDLFSGNASIGGVWYNGTEYPEAYQNTYFHADYGKRWIKVFKFSSAMEPESVEDFTTATSNGPIVGLSLDPVNDELYYIRYGTKIRKITYSPTGNQTPVAEMTVDQYYSASNSMTVSFDASTSSDPNGDALTYTWDFGDGASGSGPTPSHTYTTVGTTPANFTATVTVEDPGGLTNIATRRIFLNNTPPSILSTSLDGTTTYSVIEDEYVNLSASVTDDTPGALTYAWQTVLHHDNHTHEEPLDYNDVTTTLVSAIGCDGPTYFYRIHLTVTDSEGLSSTVMKELQPVCAPLGEDDKATYVLGETLILPVLENDLSEDAIDLSSFVFKTLPSNGTVSYNSSTGEVTYVQDGTDVLSDTFTYRISDIQGDTSGHITTVLNWIGRPTIEVLSPLDASSVDEKALKLTYYVSGDTTLIHGIQFQVDSDAPTRELTLTGDYKFFDLGIGSKTLSVTLLDDTDTPLSYTESSDDVTVNTRIVGANIKLLTGRLENVGSTWQTVTLDSTYTSMVVVATPVLNSSADLPAVSRIRNAAGNSFELMVQNPSGTALSGYDVHYIVVEEGVYTEAADGIKMEAQLVSTTKTASSSGGWNSKKEKRDYNNSYISPVVLTQVMTSNDPAWSVGWSSSYEVFLAPTDQRVFGGLHVGEDPSNTRVSEDVGVIVFNTGNYVLRARPFTVGVGYEGVQGVDDSPTGSTYALSGMENPLYGVMSSAGMNDSDGGWPVFLGSDPLSSSGFTLAIDEDQIGDTERSHASEKVAYFVADSMLMPPSSSFPVEWLSFDATPIDTKVRLDWATASESNNDFFTIERSKDGLIFQQLFNTPSVGNSQAVEAYQGFDEEPLPGRAFYRLKQTDLDGSFSYSNVIETYFDGVSFLVYPNPIQQNGTLFFELHLDRAQTVKLQILNVTGQVILEDKIALQTKDELVSLPVRQVPAGTYFVHVITSRKRYVQKILVNP